jgi:catechol 2,3-dioxygenase-like lactoylglutathione lyase family enzyme
MELEAAYPVVVTERLAECRDFYLRWFDFRVVFEASWFAHLTPAEGSPHGIAFMSPDHPSRPPGPEAFERVRGAGLRVDHPLQDEPWGQRRFGLRDPAGIWVDVVEQVEPAPGFWERYTR